MLTNKKGPEGRALILLFIFNPRFCDYLHSAGGGVKYPKAEFVQNLALSSTTRGQFRGRLLMFFARSFKVLGIRFWQTFNSQSTLMVVLYPKISVFHMGICREWCHI